MLVKISSDETHLALANSKGLVIILETFFGDLTIRPHIQNEHEGNTVTTLNWHGSELYSGDNTGVVSVFTLVIIRYIYHDLTSQRYCVIGTFIMINFNKK